MKLLIDTNVLLDSLLSRQPFADSADLLMELGAAKEFNLYMSASQFADAAYILSEGGRKSQIAAACNVLRETRKAVRIAMLDESDVDAVLASD